MAIQVHRPGKNLCGCRQCGCYDDSPHSDQDISQMNWKMIRRELLRREADDILTRSGCVPEWATPGMIHGRLRKQAVTRAAKRTEVP